MSHGDDTALPKADSSDYPGVDLVDGPAGRRPRLAGSGLDIWEVIETVKDEGDSAQAAAAYLDIHVSSHRRTAGAGGSMAGLTRSAITCPG